MRKLTAKIPDEDYETFRANYPGYGDWTHFVRECLRLFNELHTAETHEDLIKTVVKEVKEDME